MSVAESYDPNVWDCEIHRTGIAMIAALGFVIPITGIVRRLRGPRALA
jgi:hypothetical protein